MRRTSRGILLSLENSLNIFFISMVIFSAEPSNSFAAQATINLTTSEKAWIEENHTIRVRIGEYPPTYYIENDKPVGIVVDILNEISKRTGIKFHFVVPSPTFSKDLEGIVKHTGPDLLPILQKSTKREEEILFTKPYMTSPRFIFTRIDVPFVSSMKDLSGKTVAAEKDFLVHKWLSGDYPNINVQTYENSKDAIQAVSSGNIFAYIGPLRVTASLINNNGYQNIKAAAPSSFPNFTSSMAIRNDWPELQSILNKGFSSLSEAEKTTIINKWSTLRVEHGIQFIDILKWVFVTLSFSLVAVLMFVFWNKKLKREVQRKTEEWEKTFDAMSDIVTIQDKSMRIVRANKAAHQVFKEAEYGKLNEKNCYEIFTGTSEPCPGCPMLDTLSSMDPHSAIMTHKTTGNTFRVSTAAISSNDGELQYLVHTAKDITEQIRLEEELFQSHKMEAVGTLAGGIAHDFNNILAAIIGYSEFIQDAVPADSPIGRDINKVLVSAKRAVELVKQILTFSRKTDSTKQTVYPHLLISEALKMLRSTLPTSITIETDIDRDSGMILADPTSIHQIIVNLCTNASHAMPDKKGVLSVSLQSKKCKVAEMIGKTALPPGNFIVLTVHDGGHGMDKTTLNRIFEPYFSTKELGDGTGLGLALVHGIVQECNGFIDVESTVGEGSTFKIIFPAIKKPSSQPIVAIPKDKT